MYKAWRKTIPAAVGALGLAASSALASPASMAMSQPFRESTTAPAPPKSSFWPWSKADSTMPTATPVTAQAPLTMQSSQAITPVAPEETSAWKHPIKYISASMPGKSKAPTHPVMPPAQQKSDVLSLSTPTGPPTPEFYIFAAQMCEKHGDIVQARQNLQKAVSMWPNNADVLRAAARMEDRQCNMPVAESMYQRAVTANPQNAAALNDLGLCLAREGKLEPSLQVLEQAIHIQPDKSLYRNNAATVLVEMRQDQKALAHLAAVHNPAEANFNLGQLLVDRGRPADAVGYFQIALQLNPGMQSASEALAKLGTPSTTPSYAQQMPVAPVVPQQQVAPSGPSFGPQMQPAQSGPQLSYPATARTPGVGTSSYVAPRYAPPVASQPTRPLFR